MGRTRRRCRRSWSRVDAVGRLGKLGAGQPERLLEVIDALEARRAASCAYWTAGSKSAISTAMIAMTTRSSMSVKPGRP